MATDYIFDIELHKKLKAANSKEDAAKILNELPEYSTPRIIWPAEWLQEYTNPSVRCVVLNYTNGVQCAVQPDGTCPSTRQFILNMAAAVIEEVYREPALTTVNLSSLRRLGIFYARQENASHPAFFRDLQTVAFPVARSENLQTVQFLLPQRIFELCNEYFDGVCALAFEGANFLRALVVSLPQFYNSNILDLLEFAEMTTQIPHTCLHILNTINWRLCRAPASDVPVDALLYFPSLRAVISDLCRGIVTSSTRSNRQVYESAVESAAWAISKIFEWVLGTPGRGVLLELEPDDISLLLSPVLRSQQAWHDWECVSKLLLPLTKSKTDLAACA